jgi:hypothetical protein
LLAKEEGVWDQLASWEDRRDGTYYLLVAGLSLLLCA